MSQARRHRAFALRCAWWHSSDNAQVSTPDQNLDLQVDALKAAGCTRVFSDKASGALTERPALKQALDDLRPDDVLVVWSWTGWAGRCGI